MVWAANDLCEAKEVYMKMNCRAACSLCKREPIPRVYGCEDAYENCTTWAKYDLCARNEEFMSQACRKSCGTYGVLVYFNRSSGTRMSICNSIDYTRTIIEPQCYIIITIYSVL